MDCRGHESKYRASEERKGDPENNHISSCHIRSATGPVRYCCRRGLLFVAAVSLATKCTGPIDIIITIIWIIPSTDTRRIKLTVRREIIFFVYWEDIQPKYANESTKPSILAPKMSFMYSSFTLLLLLIIFPSTAVRHAADIITAAFLWPCLIDTGHDDESTSHLEDVGRRGHVHFAVLPLLLLVV